MTPATPSSVLVAWGSPLSAVAVFRGEREVFWACTPPCSPPSGHEKKSSWSTTEHTLPSLVRQAYEQEGAPQALCTLASPGSFTALRATKAFLSGLSLGWGCPLFQSLTLQQLLTLRPPPGENTAWLMDGHGAHHGGVAGGPGQPFKEIVLDPLTPGHGYKNVMVLCASNPDTPGLLRDFSQTMAGWASTRQTLG